MDDQNQKKTWLIREGEGGARTFEVCKPDVNYPGLIAQITPNANGYEVRIDSLDVDYLWDEEREDHEYKMTREKLDSSETRSIKEVREVLGRHGIDWPEGLTDQLITRQAEEHLIGERENRYASAEWSQAERERNQLLNQSVVDREHWEEVRREIAAAQMERDGKLGYDPEVWSEEERARARVLKQFLGPPSFWEPIQGRPEEALERKLGELWAGMKEKAEQVVDVAKNALGLAEHGAERSQGLEERGQLPNESAADREHWEQVRREAAVGDREAEGISDFERELRSAGYTIIERTPEELERQRDQVQERWENERCGIWPDPNAKRVVETGDEDEGYSIGRRR